MRQKKEEKHGRPAQQFQFSRVNLEGGETEREKRENGGRKSSRKCARSKNKKQTGRKRKEHFLGLKDMSVQTEKIH